VAHIQFQIKHLEADETDSKEYWKMINSGRKQISPNISINVLFDFFKTLNTGEPENEGGPPVFTIFRIFWWRIYNSK
jgi:hypothetical protein